MVSSRLGIHTAATLLLIMGGWVQAAAQLKPETIQGYDQYVRELETNFGKRFRGEMPFLWSDRDPAHWSALKHGRILIDELKDLPEIREEGSTSGWGQYSSPAPHSPTCSRC